MYDIREKVKAMMTWSGSYFPNCQTASFLLEKNMRKKLSYIEESTSCKQPKFLSLSA